MRSMRWGRRFRSHRSDLVIPVCRPVPCRPERSWHWRRVWQRERRRGRLLALLAGQFRQFGRAGKRSAPKWRTDVRRRHESRDVQPVLRLAESVGRPTSDDVNGSSHTSSRTSSQRLPPDGLGLPGRSASLRGSCFPAIQRPRAKSSNARAPVTRSSTRVSSRPSPAPQFIGANDRATALN